jgi:cytochrome c peroxidase
MLRVPMLVAAAGLALLAGCDAEDRILAPASPAGSSVQADETIQEGRRLFDHETFGGNGRTCSTCHMPGNGTITVEAVAERLAEGEEDPLFLHDGLDDGIAGTGRIAAHATIRIELELPPNVTLASDPTRRTIVVNRGVPTTMNAPALDGGPLAAFMYDLRDADLQAQALGAIRGHALNTIEPTQEQLDAIAVFQQTDGRFFSSSALQAFANGGPPPELPEGRTSSEKRGRLFFIDTPSAPGQKQGACAFCHSGPMLNAANQFAFPDFRSPEGVKVNTALVSEANTLGNPTYTFLVDNGSGDVRTVTTPDPGVLLTVPRTPHLNAFLPPPFAIHPANFTGFFKVPSLWGLKHTPPYFHDNSAKTLRDVVDHYGDVFFGVFTIGGERITLTEQDREDIVAFLRIL